MFDRSIDGRPIFQVGNKRNGKKLKGLEKKGQQKCSIDVPFLTTGGIEAEQYKTRLSRLEWAGKEFSSSAMGHSQSHNGSPERKRANEETRRELLRKTEEETFLGLLVGRDQPEELRRRRFFQLGEIKKRG